MRALMPTLALLTALAATEAPILKLPFDEASGPKTKDAVEGLSGAIKNAVWTTGVSGSALAFTEGGKSVVVFPDAPQLNPARLSLSLWFKPGANQKDKQMLVKMGSGKDGYRVNVSVDRVYWQIPGDDKAWNYGFYSTKPFTAGSWNHVVCTYDGTNMRIHLNGVNAGSLARSGAVRPVAAPLCIGAFNADGGAAFSGALDEVLLYNRALAPDEVQKIYAAGMKALGEKPAPAATQGAPVANSSPSKPGASGPVKKMLIIGNSISKHGPKADLGWSGNWGMAASTEDKDYVHLVYAKVCAAQADKPELVTSGVGGGTIKNSLANHSAITAHAADLVIVQLGENDRDATEAGFEKPYEDLVAAVKAANPNVRVYCCGTWRCGTEKDAMIKAVCQRQGVVYVDIAAIHADPAGSAGAEGRFTHAGVNWHPGDKGMQGYATEIWKAMLAQPTMPAPVAGAKVATPQAKAAPGGVLFQENFEGESPKAWSGAVALQAGKNGNALFLSAEKPEGSRYASIALPIEKFRGKKITIEAMVKAEGVSEKPKNYNGIKCMLLVSDAENRKDYPQAQVGTGTFDWQKIAFTYAVHSMAVTLHLQLGLELVSGKVWFDEVAIREAGN